MLRQTLAFTLAAIGLPALVACAHAAPPAPETPSAPPAASDNKNAVPGLSPTVPAASLSPATVESIEPAPPACQLTAADVAHLHQFAKIRHYLRQQAFPQWETSWPHLFLYGEHCQYILNYADNPGEGFRLSNQKLELNGFVTDLVFYRENAVTLPNGSKLPYFIPAQTFTYGDRDGEKWFVMGLYDVWRRDYNDSMQSFFGMLSREMFRSFQARVPGLKARGLAATRDALARFCRQNPEFARMVDEERSLLMRAISEGDSAKKRDWTKQYLEHEARRRARFFVGERAGWRHDEPWLETLDGSAEYMNFRVLTDCPDLPKDPRLTDPPGKAFAACGKVSLTDAMRQVAFRPSYLEDLGVLQTVLLNQVAPHWQDNLFHGDSAAAAMLSAYAGLEFKVTR